MFPGWDEVLTSEFEKDYFVRLQEFVAAERAHGTVYPSELDVFRAFQRTSQDRTRVVILGQDPYHGPGQAHGLSFSVPHGVTPPPSLRNIFRELHDDTGNAMPTHGCLDHWASQGVLLLNTTLTVRAGEAGSHRGRGWETFTDAVIDAIAARTDCVVFVLWGEHARRKAARLASTTHVVIESAHPSPLSARNGFFGSKPFSRTNDALRIHGHAEIDWSLPPA